MQITDDNGHLVDVEDKLVGERLAKRDFVYTNVDIKDTNLNKASADELLGEMKKLTRRSNAKFDQRVIDTISKTALMDSVSGGLTPRSYVNGSVTIEAILGIASMLYTVKPSSQSQILDLAMSVRDEYMKRELELYHEEVGVALSKEYEDKFKHIRTDDYKGILNPTGALQSFEIRKEAWALYSDAIVKCQLGWIDDSESEFMSRVQRLSIILPNKFKYGFIDRGYIPDNETTEGDTIDTIFLFAYYNMYGYILTKDGKNLGRESLESTTLKELVKNCEVKFAKSDLRNAPDNAILFKDIVNLNVEDLDNMVYGKYNAIHSPLRDYINNIFDKDLNDSMRNRNVNMFINMLCGLNSVEKSGAVLRTLYNVLGKLKDTKGSYGALNWERSPVLLSMVKSLIDPVAESIEEIKDEVDAYLGEEGGSDRVDLDKDDDALMKDFDKPNRAFARKYNIGNAGFNQISFGGYRAKECVITSALSGNYKTGMATVAFAGIMTHNRMWDNKNKKPAMLWVSHEDDLNKIIPEIYQHVREYETGEGVMIPVNVTNAEAYRMAKYIKDVARRNNIAVFFIRTPASESSIITLKDEIEKLERKGYQLTVVVDDYIEQLLGAEEQTTEARKEIVGLFRDLGRKKGFLGISPWQLGSPAVEVRKELDDDDFIKAVAGKGYYNGSRTLVTNIDLEVTSHIVGKDSATGAYLSVGRGKHKGVTESMLPTSKHFTCIPFPTIGALRLDYHNPQNRQEPDNLTVNAYTPRGIIVPCEIHRDELVSLKDVNVPHEVRTNPVLIKRIHKDKPKVANSMVGVCTFVNDKNVRVTYIATIYGVLCYDGTDIKYLDGTLYKEGVRKACGIGAKPLIGEDIVLMKKLIKEELTTKEALNHIAMPLKWEPILATDLIEEKKIQEYKELTGSSELEATAIIKEDVVKPVEVKEEIVKTVEKDDDVFGTKENKTTNTLSSMF